MPLGLNCHELLHLQRVFTENVVTNMRIHDIMHIKLKKRRYIRAGGGYVGEVFFSEVCT